MRIFPALLIAVLLLSCGTAEQPGETQNKNPLDTNLRLPEIKAGMAIDSTLTSIHIFSITDSSHRITDVWVQVSGELTEVVNIYADAEIGSVLIDSVINVHCAGRDLRLAGLNNGQELVIPFHTLHRFLPRTDTIGLSEHACHVVFVSDSDLTVNDRATRYTNSENYFRAFYSDAFRPLDSSILFPQRKPHRHTIESLMLEGQAWDETDIKDAPDTAAMLAAYNSFVNRLEVFQKAGSFTTMHLALMEVEPLQVSWGRMMQIFSGHYITLHALRGSAEKYLADRIANNGGDPSVRFTDEDLRLLYPDRLRWNGRMSGTDEHHYDPDLLAPWRWTGPPPPVRVPEAKVSSDV
jgi:hypothetical protein